MNNTEKRIKRGGKKVGKGRRKQTKQKGWKKEGMEEKLKEDGENEEKKHKEEKVKVISSGWKKGMKREPNEGWRNNKVKRWENNEWVIKTVR